MDSRWKFLHSCKGRWSDGAGRRDRRTEEPEQARYLVSRQIRIPKGEDVTRTESQGEYGRALSQLPGKASSITLM